MHIQFAFGHRKILVEFPQEQKINVAQLFNGVRKNYPDIFQHMCAKDGSINSSIQAFVNGEHIRYLNGLETELKEGDKITLSPAFYGG